jgi:hypothetical protein
LKDHRCPTLTRFFVVRVGNHKPPTVAFPYNPTPLQH